LLPGLNGTFEARNHLHPALPIFLVTRAPVRNLLRLGVPETFLHVRTDELQALHHFPKRRFIGHRSTLHVQKVNG
jgi:hypothetical protein